MYWEQQVQYASVTDIGVRRRNNQDTCTVQICADRETWQQFGHLFLVADGMGGHAVGELASEIAAHTVSHTFFKMRSMEVREALRRAIETANASVYERGAHNRDFHKMGTTCTALLLGPQGAIIGHVGDSRCYRIRGRRIEQLTFDHSLQWELIRQGTMKPDEVYLREPRHVITRSLGPQESVEIDMEGPFIIRPDDTFVLCSDGLTGHLDDSEIGIVARELVPEDACRLLVHLANLRGGSDNITVIIARVEELPHGVVPERQPLEGEDETGLDWWWVLGTWAIAALFAGGVSLALLVDAFSGGAVTALAVLLFAALLVYWGKQRRRVLPAGRSDVPETTVWNPYQTASAQMDRQFLNQIAAVEAELAQTAAEEEWTINWSQHQTAYRRAQQALADRRHGRALKHYAKAIDLLMGGFHLYRKQAGWQSKEDKGSSAEN